MPYEKGSIRKRKIFFSYQHILGLIINKHFTATKLDTKIFKQVDFGISKILEP